MVDYNIKNIRQDFKDHGVFYTPPELALKLKQYVDFEPDEVYDPTCGSGSLLSVFSDDVKKFGQELNPAQLEEAKNRLINFEGIAGDTLKAPGFVGKKFKCIVANYPYSVKWEPMNDERFESAPCLPPPSKADYAFILHILHYLDDEGIAVTLNFPGILYRGQREGKIREWLIRQNYVDKVIAIPPNTFVDTSIATAIIVFRKHRETTDIYFEDTALKKSRVVSLNEITENGYNLSVSNYIEPDVIKEIIDPEELQQRARNGFKARLINEINFDQQVCKIEGWDWKPYVYELIEILQEVLQREEKDER